MMRIWIPAATAACILIGCTSDQWRAKTVEAISNDKSQVFQIDEMTYGKYIKVQKYKLANGLKIIMLNDPMSPLFAYHTWFLVGSRNEKEGTTGIAHLFE